jgi:hypothetical protein
LLADLIFINKNNFQKDAADSFFILMACLYKDPAISDQGAMLYLRLKAQTEIQILCGL